MCPKSNGLKLFSSHSLPESVRMADQVDQVNSLATINATAAPLARALAPRPDEKINKYDFWILPIPKRARWDPANPSRMTILLKIIFLFAATLSASFTPGVCFLPSDPRTKPAWVCFASQRWKQLHHCQCTGVCQLFWSLRGHIDECQHTLYRRTYPRNCFHRAFG